MENGRSSAHPPLSREGGGAGGESGSRGVGDADEPREGGPEDPDEGPRRWRQRPWRTGCLTVLALVVLCLLWQLATWPDVARLAEENPETTAFIERWKDRQEGDRSPAWRWAPYGRISNHLKHAVVVAEDINFFSHDGFDTDEIEAALEKAWQEKKFPRGASTLTQQLAKNLWLSPSRNPWRKVEEAILTRQLEEHLSKRRILEIYLNVVEFGDGIYGAEAAARHYFGVPAGQLTADQAAQLAASLPRPKTWHPGVDRRGYRHRVAVIRERMRQAGWVRGEL